MGPLSQADISPEGCRVIALDRPPFGLTERPLQWPGGDAMSPYTSEVCLTPLSITPRFNQCRLLPLKVAQEKDGLA